MCMCFGWIVGVYSVVNKRNWYYIDFYSFMGLFLRIYRNILCFQKVTDEFATLLVDAISLILFGIFPRFRSTN